MLKVSLLFFADRDSGAAQAQYGLLLDAARFADRNGFTAVWLPERHFHSFGGAYPNPALAASAVATATNRIRIRAGSVVLPLNHPVRVVEDWSFIDNLSNGRVDLAFATGWNSNDFALCPERYRGRREYTLATIPLVESIWSGGAVRSENGSGDVVELHTYPRPVQPRLSVWLTCTNSDKGFVEAGTRGYNVLTGLLAQTADSLARKIRHYRDARTAAGHDPATGTAKLMLHTYLGESVEEARLAVEAPLKAYLRSARSLWGREMHNSRVEQRLSAELAINFGFLRYYRKAGLLGTAESCMPLLQRLITSGVDEVACLIDFGIDTARVLASLERVPTLPRRL